MDNLIAELDGYGAGRPERVRPSRRQSRTSRRAKRNGKKAKIFVHLVILIMASNRRGVHGLIRLVAGRIRWQIN